MQRPSNAPRLDADVPCDIWTGGLDQGYGRTWVGGKAERAHRVRWIEEVGPLPADVDLHHICRNRACRALAHLEPLTHSEHARMHGAQITHCCNGHAFTPENTYRRPGDGRRQCRKCKYERQKRDREASRQAERRAA